MMKTAIVAAVLFSGVWLLAVGEPAQSLAQSSTGGPSEALGSGVLELGPAPSWQLNQGAADTCDSTSGFSLMGVEVNIPVGQASEQGVLSAPGFPDLGFTTDSAFGPFVGALGGFFVFLNGPYSLPPNTVLTLQVTTYNGTNFTGGVSYVSTISWDCTTGTLVAVAAPTMSFTGIVVAGAALLLSGMITVRLRRRV